MTSDIYSDTYRLIGEELTAPEKEALRDYVDNQSGLFQLFFQYTHFDSIDSFEEARNFSLPKLAALVSATKKHELVSPRTLFSGHGNGASTFGSLEHSDPTSFEGMTWSYRGVTSTSERESEALNFMSKRTLGPVLLRFRLPVGFLCLPVDKYFPGHEGEVLLPPSFACSIAHASRINGFLDLTLDPKA
jgi:hypothetical protein